MIGQSLIVNKEFVKKIDAQTIVNYQDVSKSHGVDLRPEDIIVKIPSLNWGKGSQNPLDDVLFFKEGVNMGKLKMIINLFMM